MKNCITLGAALALFVLSGCQPQSNATEIVVEPRENPEPTTHLADGQEVPSQYALKPWEFEGKESVSYYEGAIWRKMQAGAYEELEALGAELRKPDGARYVGGSWKLGSFYEAVTHLYPENEGEYTKRFAALDEWQEKFPDSISVPIARAALMVDYAWEARGSGWASTVTEEGWRKFAERLEEARTMLEAVKAKASVCPGWYNQMQRLALGQGWAKDDYNKLFGEATTKFPEYYPLYHSKAYFLQPKWHGEPGEWHAFALDMGRGVGPHIYTRIVQGVHAKEDMALFMKTHAIDWPLMKQGWEKIHADFPHSVARLNDYCMWAVAAGDKETAKKLFAEIDGRYTPGTWGSREKFVQAATWAQQ